MKGFQNLAMVPDRADLFFNRASLGFWQKVNIRRRGYTCDALINYLPRGLRRNYGLIDDGQINAVFDASGFAYSDQWGMRWLNDSQRQLRAYRKRHTHVPYILMPQAYGPFRGARSQRAIRDICSMADVVFVRDNASLAFLIDDLPSDCSIPVLTPVSALEIKGAIGASAFVLSSRFHGLVSSLSQGIPSFATGWSHKYDELMKDFGVQDCLLSVDAGLDYIRARVRQVKAIGDSIRHSGQMDRYRLKVEEMWHICLRCLHKAK